MKPLDVDLLLASGSIEGPYTKPRPVTRSFRRSLGLFWRALGAFLANPKGPML